MVKNIVYDRRFRAVAAAASLFVPAAAFAQTSKIGRIISETAEVMTDVIAVLLAFSITVFGWGIVKLIYAGGDPQKIKDAKGIIWWGVIGIFVLAAISGIIYFIQEYLGIPGGGGVTPWQIPRI
jgi:hypothetical protein